MKSTRLDILLPGWLKIKLQELAEAKGVTPSEYIRDILKSHVEKETEKGE